MKVNALSVTQSQSLTTATAVLGFSSLILFFCFWLCCHIIDNAFNDHHKGHDAKPDPPLTRGGDPPANKGDEDPKKTK